jgi:hypothetical protein
MESTLKGLKRFLFFQPIACELEIGRFSTTAFNPCPTGLRFPNYISGPRAADVFAHLQRTGLTFNIEPRINCQITRHLLGPK